MSINFKPLIKQKFDVGRIIKSTKKRYYWKFEVDGNQHRVEMFVNRLSGKKQVLLNGEIKVDIGRKDSYKGMLMCLGKHHIRIIDKGDGDYDLTCDNISFFVKFIYHLESNMKKQRDPLGNKDTLSNRDRSKQDEPDSVSISNEPDVEESKLKQQAVQNQLKRIQFDLFESPPTGIHNDIFSAPLASIWQNPTYYTRLEDKK